MIKKFKFHRAGTYTLGAPQGGWSSTIFLPGWLSRSWRDIREWSGIVQRSLSLVSWVNIYRVLSFQPHHSWISIFQLIVVSWRLSFSIHEPLDHCLLSFVSWLKSILCVCSFHEPLDQGRVVAPVVIVSYLLSWSWSWLESFYVSDIRDVSWHPYRQEIISSSWDFSVLRWGCHTFVEIIMNNPEDQTRIVTQISYQSLMMTSQWSGGTGWRLLWRWTRPRLTRRRRTGRGRARERKGWVRRVLEIGQGNNGRGVQKKKKTSKERLDNKVIYSTEMWAAENLGGGEVRDSRCNENLQHFYWLDKHLLSC